MHIVLIILFVSALLVGPGWWVQRIIQRYSEPNDRYRDCGTGGELARHLLDRFEMRDIAVEVAESGDHYDPQAQAVRLTRDHYDGYSLAAITIAAHEVGHAIQHRRGEKLFQWRHRLVGFAQHGERFGAVLMLLLPLVLILTQAPYAALIFLLGGMLSIGMRALVHLLTLPVEWDASFGKALPILEQGYLKSGDHTGARRLLKAAALTYVASSLLSLLNVWRWLRILRR